jgi:hypothetical protein
MQSATKRVVLKRTCQRRCLKQMTTLRQKSELFTSYLKEMTEFFDKEYMELSCRHEQDESLSKERWAYLNEMVGLALPYPDSIGFFFAWPPLRVARPRSSKLRVLPPITLQKFLTYHGQWFLKNGNHVDQGFENQPDLNDEGVRHMLLLMKAVSEHPNTEWPARLFGHMDGRLLSLETAWVRMLREEFDTYYPTDWTFFHHL